MSRFPIDGARQVAAAVLLSLAAVCSAAAAGETDVRIFRGDARHAYRDPAAVWHDGRFYLFFTLVETEDDGSVFSYMAESESPDLVRWTPPRKLTPRDNTKDYSSPGNVVKDGDEWVLCLQTYPRPGNRDDGKIRYANENARLFTMRSRDLRDWTAPELLKVKGPDVPEEEMGRMIDPYLLKLPDGGWMCFYKQNGVSFSKSPDLKTWTSVGRAEAGENVCVVRDGGRYLMVHSPENGLGLKTSADLVHWQDLPGRITLGQADWPWARGRLTAGFLLDARQIKGVGRWLLFFHASGPRREHEGDFDRNASLALVRAGTVEELLDAVWVSPRGDDSADGTRARPLRTIGKAVASVREKARNRICVEDGTYELEEPLTLGPEDSGLTVVAAPGASPVFSAGYRIAGWTVDGRGWWKANVARSMKFSQFYVNGIRRPRPYLPRKGYFAQARKPQDPEPETGLQRIAYLGGDIDLGWKGLEDAEFCFFHIWTMSRMPPVSVDPGKRVVTLGRKAFNRQDNFPFGNGRSYRVDNLLDALGEPGDWYLGRDGVLTYVPLPGETPETTEAVAARHGHVVKACGTTNVVFRGIAFAHANWNMPKDGSHFVQAAFGLPAAVETEYCRGFRLENCTVAHTGAWGVSFGDGSRDCAVEGCHLADLGAGGVKIGARTQGGGDPEPKLGAGCSVVNSLIEHGGRVDPAGCGVWIGNAHHCRVAHNTIRDMYYTGVSSGWRWALGPNPAHDNIIEWNRIHDIGQHVLSDMGGIYTLGMQPGTVERYNHIHGIDCQVSGNGIYFDSGSAGIAVSNNVVHDVSDGAWFMARISATNLVANNIFGFASRAMVINPQRNPDSVSSVFRNNILVWDAVNRVVSESAGEETVFSSNIAWNVRGEGAKGLPSGLECVDPRFRDASGRDFSFADETVVRSRGFLPFSVKDAGYSGTPGNGYGVESVPAVFSAVFPQTVPFEEDFESFKVGACPWTVHPKAALKLITVTDRIAASGHKSLEVVNSVGGWMPHFNVAPFREKGRVKVSFSLLFEKGASFEVSMRDPDRWITAPGPTFRVDAAANLLADGRTLMALPVGKWLRIELEFELGKDRASDTFSLSCVPMGGGAPRTFAGLGFHRDFRRMNWIGFMCGGCSKGERYYVDDFRVTP